MDIDPRDLVVWLVASQREMVAGMQQAMASQQKAHEAREQSLLAEIQRLTPIPPAPRPRRTRAKVQAHDSEGGTPD